MPDIDRLYQLPLGDFTAARNALAKTAGARAAEVKALEKPTAAAWAVNQLYWRERKTWGTLVRASDRVRAAHQQLLKGKKVDLATLEAQHGAAVKQASEIVRALLAQSGDPATPATMKSVVDTLHALPGGGELFVRHDHLVKLDGARRSDSIEQRGTKGVRLLIHLFGHEVLKAALLSGLEVPVHVEFVQRHCGAVEITHRESLGS